MNWAVSRALIAATLVAGMVGPAALAQQPPPAGAPVRAITNIRGDLYRVRDNNHYTLFYVTTDGIIVGDPINVAAATWLKGELATRFPNRPVRYVLMSHHDFDHAAGARVFNDTAEVVGHESFNTALKTATTTLPGFFAGLDQNRNQILERAELQANPIAGVLLAQDRNGDGNVAPSEIFADVLPVESSYRDRRTITLGGKTVNLIYTGKWHAEDMTAVHFPAERVVFSVDYPPVKSLPVAMTPTPQDHINGARAIEAIDFDTFVPGHGEIGTKADVVAYRTFVEELVAGVQAGIRAGQTLEQIQAGLTLDKYSSWQNFAMTKNNNIAEVYRGLQPRR